MREPLYYRYKELKAKGKIAAIRKVVKPGETWFDIDVRRYDRETGEELGVDTYSIRPVDLKAARDRIVAAAVSAKDLIDDLQAL